MASMNNAIPMLPKHFDLKDAVDKTDRLLEVTQQVVTQLQGQIYPLVISPDGTGTAGGTASGAGTVYTAGNFPKPAWVSVANETTYGQYLTNGTLATLIAAIDTEYGLYELAAAMQFKLNQIALLNSGNISNVA